MINVEMKFDEKPSFKKVHVTLVLENEDTDMKFTHPFIRFGNKFKGEFYFFPEDNWDKIITKVKYNIEEFVKKLRKESVPSTLTYQIP